MIYDSFQISVINFFSIVAAGEEKSTKIGRIYQTASAKRVEYPSKTSEGNVGKKQCV
jgi:hypothetical protein